MASIVGPLDEQMILAFLAPYRPRTRENYRFVLLSWLRWCAAAKVPLLKAERVHIEAWRRHESARGITDNTIRTQLSPIAGFYRWAYEEGHISRDPAVHIRRPRGPQASTRDWLSRSELARVLECAESADTNARAIVYLGALNGMRLGEILRLNVTDRTRRADMPALRIRERKAGTGDVISLAPPTARAVAAAAGTRRSGPLIMASNEGRLSVHLARKALDRVIQAAGIDRRITPHCLRATFITLAIEAGVDPRIVADSAGQKSLQTTYYYDRQRNSTIHNATHRLTEWLEGN